MNVDRRARLKATGIRIFTRMLHRYFALTRGMTLGVRGACFDEQGRIFLVRHTYVPGWYLPGGGVEYYETAEEALEKELREEGNLVMTERPKLFHAYFNRSASKRDHVLLYRVNVIQTTPKIPDREIRESGFFSLDALPEDSAASTRSRVAELRGVHDPVNLW
ncbi:MAG: DNA mismatch repair protein MutT [Rhizobium sp. 63-7]|nr:MAG: DNA mismatch repair protein MutT [Rhizobium sp. 63-7]